MTPESDTTSCLFTPTFKRNTSASRMMASFQRTKGRKHPSNRRTLKKAREKKCPIISQNPNREKPGTLEGHDSTPPVEKFRAKTGSERSEGHCATRRRKALVRFTAVACRSRQLFFLAPFHFLFLSRSLLYTCTLPCCHPRMVISFLP